ncbi:cyclic nucleotide-binding domain-containing protein [Konateibacter massiliensis]|uniref:cyclic nucleotide-binding domain-containing protein n=1 Tax=Konateibacter massiliensis TaxID=2002841 RepID=UPI000C14E202|nr:cyclic nucleotide-binding domain-containing protein [Konateibacter massiliensis]
MKRLTKTEKEQLLSQYIYTGYVEGFEAVLENMEAQIYDSNEKIADFSSYGEYLSFILKGKAKIYGTCKEGESVLQHFLQRGDFIGEMVLLEAEEEKKEVISIDECICISLPMREAKDILLKDSIFLLQLNKYLAEKMLNGMERFIQNPNYELRNRLAGYMLLSACDGIYQEVHAETAGFLGTSYRHLLFTLKKLYEEGYIQKIGRGYRINTKKLETLVEVL